MQVLGWSAKEYQVYSSQIRQEYIHIPEEGYRSGRSQVSQTTRGSLLLCLILPEFYSFCLTISFQGELDKRTVQIVLLLQLCPWTIHLTFFMTKISCLSTWNPTLTKYLFPPDLSLQTPHRENNLSAVRRPWLSEMDRSGAKSEWDKVCVFHNNNFFVRGVDFFFFIQSSK